MRGAWLQKGVAGMVLLFGGPSVCHSEQYDRKLEQAMMEIVAGKMGDIRGALQKEWKPEDAGELQSEKPVAADVEQPSSKTGSFVSINPPAMTTTAAQAATAMIETASQTRFELVPLAQSRRRIRVIPLYE